MIDKIPLGKPTRYADQYDPGLLFAIPRTESRAALDLGNDLPFNGCDIWTAWEITWLNAQVCCATSYRFDSTTIFTKPA